MIEHHPSPELLLDYAAGILGEGAALAVATHIAICPECRARTLELEAVGGALLETIETVPLSDDALAGLLDRLDEPMPLARPAARALDAQTLAAVPGPLRRYIDRSLNELPWRSVGRMFDEFRLPLADKRIKASLMRLRPGSLMPKHTHRGYEYTLVLAGGFRDGEHQFGRGDFAAKDTADMHQPVVDDDEECLCLAVLDAPVKLTGAVGRLVNPFLRI